jgi:hypothetical protein
MKLALLSNVTVVVKFVICVCDYSAFLHAFASNTTLTDVYLSKEILKNMDTSGEKKINFYAERNREFRKITSNLTVDEMDGNDETNDDEKDEVVCNDDNDHLSIFDISSDDSVSSTTTTIPLGLWPLILEAAYKYFPDLSMLHHLLSSQTVGLVLSGREERDVSLLLPCFFTSTNENAQSRCPSTKRDHDQISYE